MTPQLRHTLLALLSTFLFLLSAAAQSGNIRYVSTTGKNSNDGLSWANAKKDIQEAINDLAGNNLTGEVWVAAGTYYPTETTESTTSLYYKAFKIPAGITVRGGFAGSEATAGARAMTADKNFGDGTKSETIDGETFKSGVYTNKTILCGDLTPGKEAKLEWNDKKQQFDPIFYGNSYHVVWFAMNGFDAKGRANPLARPAKLEGCVIEGGHANNREMQATHPHTAYGGGIYMVLNSFVYNCEVKNCDASRNGGGIYMDGGGVVRRTYVHDCQALGLGTDFGYGGGICQYGGALTAKERPCVVAQSVVTNCVGRMGGGIGIMADQTNSSGKYAVVSNSTLVNNCTATIEGGGVYTYKGGGVASLTIVNNRCNGSGITQGGTVTGQTGGLYSYDAAYIANTVIWGNKCEANNDVQFASARSSLTDIEKCKFYHNALSRMDNANWSNVLKMGVVSLADENTSGSAGSKGYPLFFKPTASAGYLAGIDANDIVSTDTDAEKEEKKNKWTNWTVSSESSLCFAGIATSDLDTEELTPAPQGNSYDMQLGALNARPTIGALISQTGTLAPATSVTYNSVTYTKAFFVDPGFIYGADNTGANGTDWEHPALFLGNVLDYITLHPDDFTGSVAIFVKEGTVDNTRAWSNSRVRQTSLEVPSNVAIFGSFNSHLTGTNLNMQNVVQTPTVITGQLMNDYQFNIPHLLVIKDKQNILIEGFKFSYANASSTLLGNSNTDGAAITIDNSRDIRFRNIIVSNCTAHHGAAVYGTHAEATFENCIFHNNESKVLAASGIIYATNGSGLTFDHCDVLRNVGHASYLGGSGTWNVDTSDDPDHPVLTPTPYPTTNYWQNSIFYGNLSETVDDTNIDRANSDPLSSGLNKFSLAAFSGTTAGATGHHCMFDARSAQFSGQFGGGSVAAGGDTGNQWQYNLQYAFVDGTGQGYPRFINPTKNAGVTQDGDQTYYGRATSFEPHNNNPAVNMASHADIHTSWGRDIVGVTRDFGGLPDIGAVENHEATHTEEGENAYTDGQKAYGEGFFVRDYTSTGTELDTYDYDSEHSTYTKNEAGLGLYRLSNDGETYELLDGTSWEYAINGNAVYAKTTYTNQPFNTVFKSAKNVVDTENFRGTFTIHTSDNKYIYLASNGAPKTTTDASQASHFEVENVTTAVGVAAGTMYIRAAVGAKYYYFWRSSNTASGTTTLQRVVLESSGGGFTIKANNQYYVENNGNITAPAPKNAPAPTVWTFTPDYGYQLGEESAYEQDGVTAVTGSTQGYSDTEITAGTTVVDPMKFHVYKSLDDFLYSNDKKTYKIRGSVNASDSQPVHLTHKDNYFYPYPSWLGKGDEFALIQDGATDKYYIYDYTAGKYLIYKSGGSSRIQAGSDMDKTTWWIKPHDSNSSVLQFVYGAQPWNTTGGYAIYINANQTQMAKVQAKSVAQTALYLVASQDYDAINYTVTVTNDESLRGLQYAVNNAHKAYNTDYAATNSYERSKKEVWVGAGVYKSDPTFLDSDNLKGEGTQYENCFVIQDGVNVIGAFPKTGNPGLDQRQALVSQYVHVQTDNNGDPLYDYHDFETILEPLMPTTIATAANVTRRVLGQPYTYNPRRYFDEGGKNSIGTCPHFKGAKWDGFTLRNGWYDANKANYKGREGGAGAEIYHNVTLKNVIITNNTTINSDPGTQTNIRGGGLYMDGGILDAGYVINNVLAAWYATDGGSFGTAGGAGYGGGVYMYSGTTFNSVIANNRAISAYADGGGIYIENANFFNNTIVNNYSEGKTRAAGGVGIYSDPARADKSTLNVFNCIILHNEGFKEVTGTNATLGNKDFYVSNVSQGGKMNVRNCIVEKTDDYDLNSNNFIKFYDCKTVNDAAGFAALIENMGSYSDRSENNFKNLNLRLKSGSVAINSGIDAPTAYDYNLAQNVTYDLSEFNDMDYAERIQDCRVDIGAYEFNGATGIAPHKVDASGQTTDDIDSAEQLVFYVTPNGYGSTNAHDPENAACAQKLQRVLDAAGRYKYQYPKKQVIVKVANSYSMLNPDNGTKNPEDDGYKEPTNFTYYATRTTDWTDQDVRVWSIIVPRGVEVWGGYTDVPVDANWVKTSGAWSNTHNGFTLDDGVTDHRNITKNPTYFDSYYVNKLEKTDAHTYHVVTFSDRVYDINGYAYLANEGDKVATGAPSTYLELLGSDESLFLHMSKKVSGNVITEVVAGNTVPKNFGTNEAPKYASNRAVIDGIFVSGGQADAPSSSTSTTLNINSYGGAALVNDFAYVRNCILTGNTAINGGALALTDQALVSGCLILDNVAHNQGGGIYVFEEGAKLSNGTTITSLQQGGDITMDQRMAHVLTSTIVRNRAQQGGGVWYTDNVNANARFNSVAIWQNEAVDQPNVYGMVNPEQPTTDETISEIYYPFCYSAIQDIRASGTNNQNTASANSQGVRFVHKDKDVGQNAPDRYMMATEQTESGHEKYEEFGYYGLTNYSILCSTGMPKSMYGQLQAAIAIADDDILATNRIHEGKEFVEIGARALKKEFPTKQLMLRLFVAQPEDIDKETVSRFMKLGGTADSNEEYYSQEGSSFAYPFNFLQDALDYVKDARNGKVDGNTAARNLPFEILVGKGEWYPNKDLNGSSASVWAHTFAIPEGVTIVGGFNPQGGDGSYYGRYYEKDTEHFDDSNAGSIFDNVKPLSTATFTQTPSATEIGRGNRYGTEQVTLPAIPGGPDAMTIDFQLWHIQDIADRRAMFDNNKNGIIEPWEFKHQTIISGNAVNGETDGVYHIMTAVADADAVGLMPKVQKVNGDFVGSSIAEETGYQWKEQGQQIRLNGLIVTGGNALTYLSTALDDYGSYMYYHGAGLVVDGNRYKNPATTGDVSLPTFHNSAAYGVGYRDIPVSVTNCQFRDNKAGYGGAISSNGSLSLFASSFEQNKALGQTETSDGETWYTNITGSKTEVSKVAYPGQGGAIHATNQLSAFNTLFANNEACLADSETPTIDLVKHATFRVPVEANASATLRAAGGAIMMGSAGTHHIVNCNFVRNKANAYPAVFTMNPTRQQENVVNTHDYSQIINTVAWGNEVNAISSNADYLRAAKLLVNIGKKNRTTNYITTQDAGDFYDPAFTSGNVPTVGELAVDNAEESSDWQEAVWFCAYEDGVGFKQNNTNDLRDAIVYSPKQYAPTMIKAANGGTYQNCNIQIVADNNDVAGPNFGNPSLRAGYDGFMEGADWSPARFNRLTDNGNGWIKQTVAIDGSDFKVTFHNNDKVDDKVVPGTNFQGAYPVTHYISELTPEQQFPEYKLWLAIGNEKYMQATNEAEKDNIYINNTQILPQPQKNYPRISPDPTIGVTRAYIDIGVYEYQKQPLLKPGSEVDILWVSTKEKPENGPATGATWKTPTSDLQRAIETLLSSRNGHKKEIRLMEGEYTPVTPQTIGGTKYNAFVIDTKKLNGSAIVPSAYDSDEHKEKYYAQSLTIKGGYSQEIMYEYNPAQYPTIIRQNDAVDGINTDRLIYVVDPTLRYYCTNAQAYSDNKDGAIYTVAGESESNTARTMPIQIDGVTLINDAATAGIRGSAIYYPDYDGTTSAPESDVITEAHSVAVGGTVKYYTDDTHTTPSGNSGADETDYPLIDNSTSTPITNPAKIVITKTHVIGSGNESDGAATASAVYIGQNGGSALIYNSVFHSNYGMPLDAWNTVNVNNTFGLNAGLVQLQDAGGVTVKSAMHNSALWRNNGDGAQFSIPRVSVGSGGTVTISGSEPVNFTYNAFTGGNTAETDYSAGHTIASNNYNTGLTANNADIAGGPNFVDPENADIEARNFDIKPSLRLLNKGSNTDAEGTYYDKVMHHDLGASKYANYDYSLIPTTGVDVLNRPRFKNNIDIGAYEFQGSLYNPLYVDPNKAHSATAEGRSWDDAFGYGDIQSAMDLAAIYHLINTGEEGYVFVKGASATNRDLHTDETLTLRDGVTVYGSIAYNYTDWHKTKKGGDGSDKDDPKYGDGTDNPATINAYITDMASFREGVAAHTASKTRITAIKAAEHERYTTAPALLDGFVVTPVSPEQQPTAPVIDINNPTANAAIGIRNIIVADNDLSKATGTDINVAQVNNGLLYEVLMRDNKPKGTGAALRVSDNGYAVNVTVEGKTVDADGQSRVDTDGGHIYSSITNSIDSGAGTNAAGADAPYGRITNPDISGYFYNIGDANLNYQLTETSKYIDACETTNPLTGVADNLAQFINYTTDRDLLGNPRLLTAVTTAGNIDRGAFETWKVQNTGNKFICGDNGTIADAAYNDTYNDTEHAIIKKHFYPHDGSVCYIMEGQALVIDAPDPLHEVKPTPHNPGYMLLKEGASFYGNRRPATCAYVAVERRIDRKHGSIIALPYDMKYGTDVTQPVYTDSRLTELKANVVNRIYDYDAAARSAWDYIFETSATRCWTAIDGAAPTPANHGLLIEPLPACFTGSETETTFRFTAKGTSLTDFVYTENGPSKTVTLTQHDDKESTGGAADFTDKEDMGWNCIGLPYLVSNYRPYEKVNTSTGRTDAEHGTIYRLDIPHILWLYYDGVKSRDGQNVDGDGGYYSVKSRDADSWHTAASAHTVAGSDARIWVGEGFFTQTATVFDSETLTFYLPDPTASGASPSNRRNIRFYFNDDDDDNDDTSDDYLAPTLLRTEYYSVAGRRLARPDTMGVTIVRRIYSDGTVRSFKTR